MCIINLICLLILGPILYKVRIPCLMIGIRNMVGDVAQACESCPIRVDLAFQGCGALKRQALRQSVQTDGT